MTTKFLDNKISTFKILLSWRFPRKQAFLDDFPLCPQGPPPQKRKFYFYCRLAVSDTSLESLENGRIIVARVSRYTPPKKACRTCRPSTVRGVARQAASEKVLRYSGV